MKRIGLFIVWMIAMNSLNAQETLYTKLVKTLSASGVVTENKLIAVNYWSCSEATTRHANAEFERVAKVYQVAKLNGGRQGLLVVLINTNESGMEVELALEKDGITKAITLQAKDLESVYPAGTNFVFDSAGRQILGSLLPEHIFNSINQLIIR